MYAKNTEKVFFPLKVLEDSLWFCNDDMAMFC